MAQKVITVTGYHRNDDAYVEFDFPTVTAALNDGYEVKQIHQMAMPNIRHSPPHSFWKNLVLLPDAVLQRV